MIDPRRDKSLHLGSAPCPWCGGLVVQRKDQIGGESGHCPRCHQPIRWTTKRAKKKGARYVKEKKPPKPLSNTAAEVLELLRRSHCAHPEKKCDAHRCAGVFTARPHKIELDCRLCGHSEKPVNQEAMDV